MPTQHETYWQKKERKSKDIVDVIYKHYSWLYQVTDRSLNIFQSFFMIYKNFGIMLLMRFVLSCHIVHTNAFSSTFCQSFNLNSMFRSIMIIHSVFFYFPFYLHNIRCFGDSVYRVRSNHKHIYNLIWLVFRPRRDGVVCIRGTLLLLFGIRI